MTTITLDRRPAYVSRRIIALARLIATLPARDGTQQSRLVELFTALLAAGVGPDALYCALEDAAGEVTNA